MIEIYPEDYEGHHLYFILKMDRQHFEEALLFASDQNPPDEIKALIEREKVLTNAFFHRQDQDESL
ncbi:hypothetical protein [Hespellia stercorisuis]|nr:hypothetical protein [Hespellia stercorisuis]